MTLKMITLVARQVTIRLGMRQMDGLAAVVQRLPLITLLWYDFLWPLLVPKLGFNKESLVARVEELVDSFFK